MSRVLLVNLPDPLCVVPPIGLWSIKANSKDDCSIWDCNLPHRLIDMNTDVLGISARFSIQHQDLLEWAKRGKTWRTYVVAGGQHASTFNSMPNVDHIHHGPYPGDKLPVIPLNVLEEYWKIGKPHNLQSMTKKWVPIETSRGCNFSCNFCGMSSFWGRWRPLQGLEKQLVAYKDMGVEEVFIEDDNLAYDKNHLIYVMRMLKSLGMFWSTPNGIAIKSLLDPDVMRELKDSTCWRLSLPFETGNPRTAKLMNTSWKYFNLQQAKWLIDRLKGVNIRVAGFFLIGYPGETESDIKRTLDYANSLPLDDRYVYIATPYPGTPLYEECKEKGYLICDGEELYKQLSYTKCLIRTPWLEPERVDQLREEDRKAHGNQA